MRKFKKEGGKKGNTSQQDSMREAMGEERFTPSLILITKLKNKEKRFYQVIVRFMKQQRPRGE